MTNLQKRLLDNVINNAMFKNTSIENDFLLFSTILFIENETNILMHYFDCSRSKISKLRNGLQNYPKNDLEKLNELHKIYKNYVNDIRHMLGID